MGEPFAPRRPGCGGQSRNRHCNGRPAWVGLKYYRGPRRLWRAFACDEHVWQLDVARPLDEAAAAELARRREQYRVVMEGRRPYVPEPPVAEGAEALRVLAAARAWAAGRPECRVASTS